jgi:hypothetical protein
MAKVKSKQRTGAAMSGKRKAAPARKVTADRRGPKASSNARAARPSKRIPGRKKADPLPDPGEPSALMQAAARLDDVARSVAGLPSRRAGPVQLSGEHDGDGRVALAIALALADEHAIASRARELAAPPSIWSLTARVARPLPAWKG